MSQNTQIHQTIEPKTEHIKYKLIFVCYAQDHFSFAQIVVSLSLFYCFILLAF
jgi:hypothetical protein